jgi:hypothetical protein
MDSANGVFSRKDCRLFFGICTHGGRGPEMGKLHDDTLIVRQIC